MKRLALASSHALAATLSCIALSLPATAFAQLTDSADAIRLPEPETLALLAIGIGALIISRWTKRK